MLFKPSSTGNHGDTFWLRAHDAYRLTDAQPHDAWQPTCSHGTVAGEWPGLQLAR